MDKNKYAELFAAFGKTPMEDFLELLFEGVPPELKKRLIIEEASYKRYSAEIVSLEVWIVIDNPESDRWIWARVEYDASRNSIEDEFYTKDSYAGRGNVLNSIEECFDYDERKSTE